jgi:hypothetical protein
METPEKRQSKRLKVSLPVTFQSFGPNKYFGETTTRDISGTGLRINTDSFFSPNSNLLVRLRLPEVDKIIEGMTRVIWSHRISYSDKYQAGLQFYEINTLFKNWLEEYILINETLAS